MQIVRTPTSIQIYQSQNIESELVEFDGKIGPGGSSSHVPTDFQHLHLQDQSPIRPEFPYRPMIRYLIYAMLGRRSDIAFAVSLVCRHLVKPTELH